MWACNWISYLISSNLNLVFFPTGDYCDSRSFASISTSGLRFKRGTWRHSTWKYCYSQGCMLVDSDPHAAPGSQYLGAGREWVQTREIQQRCLQGLQFSPSLYTIWTGSSHLPGQKLCDSPIEDCALSYYLQVCFLPISQIPTLSCLQNDCRAWTRCTYPH